MAEEISQKILAALSEKPGQTARDIAGKFGLDKKEINHFLYGALKSKCRKDEKHRWFIVSDKSEGTIILSSRTQNPLALQNSYENAQVPLMNQMNNLLGTIPLGSGYFLQVEVSEFRGKRGMSIRKFAKGETGTYSGPTSQGIWIPIIVWEEIWTYLLSPLVESLNREFTPLKSNAIIKVFFENHLTYGSAVNIREYYLNNGEHKPSKKGIRIRYPDRWQEFVTIIHKYKPQAVQDSFPVKFSPDVRVEEQIDKLLDVLSGKKSR